MDREEFMLNKGRGFEQNTQKISRRISSKSIILVPKYVHVAWEIKEEILYEHNFHFANLDEEIRFVNFFRQSLLSTTFQIPESYFHFLEAGRVFSS